MIPAFQGRYRFLSNFWPCLVRWEGLVYPSSEHAFQAAKSTDQAEREAIQRLRKPDDAKKAGRAVKAFRPDWDDVRVRVMEGILKFHDYELRRLLLMTGEEELVEGNHWGDTFWGVCRGEGRNELGKLLMKVRAAIRSTGGLDPVVDGSHCLLHCPCDPCRGALGAVRFPVQYGCKCR